MAELHAFFDRDVLLKLVCCDLWEEAGAALGVTRPYRLASATATSLSKLLRRRCPPLPQAVQAASSARLASVCPTIPVVPGEWVTSEAFSKTINELQTLQGIDTGEAMLTAVAMTCLLRNCLISGDKRFVNALRAGSPDIYAELSLRLVTFERCLSEVVAEFGFDHVKAKALPARNCDGTLALALGSGEQTTERAFLDAIRAYDPSDVSEVLDGLLM